MAHLDLTALDSTPCPSCGSTSLRVEQRLTARPLGTFSLAGAQIKVSASYVPWLVCDACGVEAQGKLANR